MLLVSGNQIIRQFIKISMIQNLQKMLIIKYAIHFSANRKKLELFFP